MQVIFKSDTITSSTLIVLFNNRNHDMTYVIVGSSVAAAVIIILVLVFILRQKCPRRHIRVTASSNIGVRQKCINSGNLNSCSAFANWTLTLPNFDCLIHDVIFFKIFLIQQQQPFNDILLHSRYIGDKNVVFTAFSSNDLKNYRKKRKGIISSSLPTKSIKGYDRVKPCTRPSHNIFLKTILDCHAQKWVRETSVLNWNMKNEIHLQNMELTFKNA